MFISVASYVHTLTVTVAQTVTIAQMDEDSITGLFDILGGQTLGAEDAARVLDDMLTTISPMKEGAAEGSASVKRGGSASFELAFVGQWDELGCRPIKVSVSATDTVAAMKVKIEAQEGISADRQRFMVVGTELEDGDTLEERGVIDGSSTPVHFMLHGDSLSEGPDQASQC